MCGRPGHASQGHLYQPLLSSTAPTRALYVPPALPQPTSGVCPVDDPHWGDGGCLLVMPTAAGARIRYQLDRENEAYKRVYSQRTAAERIFSQAVTLGIERPKLRNQSAIANQNTLTYVLINLRTMQRVANRPTSANHTAR